jgi:coenzyme F420 hydrogenase subunit beta
MKITDIKKINLKEDFIITTKDNNVKHIPLSELEKVARPACFACTDYANDFADISVGGIGSPEGYSTVIIRNETGQKIYSNALRHNFIEELNLGNELDLGSGLISYEKGICLSSKARKDLLLKYARMKRKRGLDTLEKLRKEMYTPKQIVEDIKLEVEDSEADNVLEQKPDNEQEQMNLVNINPRNIN